MSIEIVLREYLAITLSPCLQERFPLLRSCLRTWGLQSHIDRTEGRIDCRLDAGDIIGE